MYLAHRGNTWHFSRRLPNDSVLQPGRFLQLSDRTVLIGRNGYIRFSLKTSDKREALRLSRQYAAEVDKALQALALRIADAGTPISDRDITLAAKLMQASILEADEQQYAAAIEAGLDGEEIPRLPDREQHLQDELPPATIAGDIELLKQLRQLIPFYMLQATGKAITGSLPGYGARLSPFILAWRQTMAQLQERATGKPVETPLDPRKDPKIMRMGWDELLSYYETQHKSLSVRTRALYRLAITELASFAKCDPIDLTREKVINWRDDLGHRLGDKTILTRLNAAGTVYRYALDNEKLGDRSNPFNKVTVDGARKAKSSRKGFELQSLEKVLAPLPDLEDLPESSGEHAALWIPILALYTGARRGELAGLRVADVGQDQQGIWYLHIRENALRSLKNEGSERFVPLHTELERLGFLEYVEVARSAGIDRLFPGIADPNSLGEWFCAHVRSRLGETGVKQDLHSFRHTFKTATRNAALNTEIHDAITGHTTPGVGAQYGDRAGLPTLKDAIDKIGYSGLTLAAPPLPTAADLKRQDQGRLKRLRAGKRRTAKAEARQATGNGGNTARQR